MGAGPVGSRLRDPPADEIMLVAFVIDAHHRETIAQVAVANCGISGSDVRGMMLGVIEGRFGARRTPRHIEFLSDNGSADTARARRDFDISLGLEPLFTPVASSESNGISEAFVKTMKPDYVRVKLLTNAATTVAEINLWFLDYNENHPHLGLKRKSSREFRSVSQA